MGQMVDVERDAVGATHVEKHVETNTHGQPTAVLCNSSAQSTPPSEQAWRLHRRGRTPRP